MVVVDSDAVHDHAAVMIILETASIALAAVVHPWTLENLAMLAEM